jgi:ABC-type lipoprotein release transport system permease subunit
MWCRRWPPAADNHEPFLYSVMPSDSVAMTIAAGVLAAVALIASYVPARRASILWLPRRA